MRIKSLRIKNNYLDWEFEEITFFYNLTLLVGVSGVGKTQILRAIDDLQDIANGRAINGFEWYIVFSTVSNKEYTWEGSFSVLDDTLFKSEDDDNEGKAKPTIIFEKLKDNAVNEYLIDRNTNSTTFNGNIMPKLSSSQSMIYILKEEPSINGIVEAFEKIIFKDHTHREGGKYHFLVSQLNHSEKVIKTLKK